jgi:F0F1-type ATP synthase assembly protein I
MDPNTVNTPPAAPAPVAGPAPVPPPAPAVVPVPTFVERKSPGLAGLLSVMPGLGHLYLGLYNRAFMIVGAFCLAIFMSARGGGEFFGPVIGFIWFFGIIDAVRQARAINLGIVTESGYAPNEQLRKAAKGTAGLFWGVVMVGIGTLWLLDRYVDIDWSFMDEWGTPLALMLLGLILIISHVRRTREDNANGTGMPPRSGS